MFHEPHQKQIEQRFGSYGNAITVAPIIMASSHRPDASDCCLDLVFEVFLERGRKDGLVQVFPNL